jgi:hypothetical protein
MLARATTIRVKVETLAAVIVASAIATSSIVFSEPAIADALMIGVVIAIPVLGVARFGRMALLNLAMWLVIVAFGLGAACVATTYDEAVKHQFVTFYLA